MEHSISKCDSDSVFAKPSNHLPKILTVLVMIAFMVGAFFAFHLYKDQQRAKTEAPFFLAAKEALDEAHKMQSAVRIGISYQKYGDMLIALGTKVDNLRRELGTGMNKTAANRFYLQLLKACDAYEFAGRFWEIKINYPTVDHSKTDKELQGQWNQASLAIEDAEKAYVKLQEQ